MLLLVFLLLLLNIPNSICVEVQPEIADEDCVTKYGDVIATAEMNLCWTAEELQLNEIVQLKPCSLEVTSKQRFNIKETDRDTVKIVPVVYPVSQPVPAEELCLESDSYSVDGSVVLSLQMCQDDLKEFTIKEFIYKGVQEFTIDPTSMAIWDFLNGLQVIRNMTDDRLLLVPNSQAKTTSRPTLAWNRVGFGSKFVTLSDAIKKAKSCNVSELEYPMLNENLRYESNDSKCAVALNMAATLLQPPCNSSLGSVVPQGGYGANAKDEWSMHDPTVNLKLSMNKTVVVNLVALNNSYARFATNHPLVSHQFTGLYAPPGSAIIADCSAPGTRLRIGIEKETRYHSLPGTHLQRPHRVSVEKKMRLGRNMLMNPFGGLIFIDRSTVNIDGSTINMDGSTVNLKVNISGGVPTPVARLERSNVPTAVLQTKYFDVVMPSKYMEKSNHVKDVEKCLDSDFETLLTFFGFNKSATVGSEWEMHRWPKGKVLLVGDQMEQPFAEVGSGASGSPLVLLWNTNIFKGNYCENHKIREQINFELASIFGDPLLDKAFGSITTATIAVAYVMNATASTTDTIFGDYEYHSSALLRRRAKYKENTPLAKHFHFQLTATYGWQLYTNLRRQVRELNEEKYKDLLSFSTERIRIRLLRMMSKIVKESLLLYFTDCWEMVSKATKQLQPPNEAIELLDGVQLHDLKIPHRNPCGTAYNLKTKIFPN